MDEDKCQRCGTPASSGATVCESCGAPLVASQPAEGAISEPAPPFDASDIEIPYQGVAIRFVAFLIDAIILGFITFLAIGLPASYNVNTTAGEVNIPGGLAGAILAFVIDLLYYTLLLGRYGQTVGKMIVKIKVVSEADGSPITYGAAFLRSILLLVDAIPYVIPYLLGAILIWTSDRKQRLGDRVAHTVVVKASEGLSLLLFRINVDLRSLGDHISDALTKRK